MLGKPPRSRPRRYRPPPGRRGPRSGAGAPAPQPASAACSAPGVIIHCQPGGPCARDFIQGNANRGGIVRPKGSLGPPGPAELAALLGTLRSLLGLPSGRRVRGGTSTSCGEYARRGAGQTHGTARVAASLSLMRRDQRTLQRPGVKRVGVFRT
jgi:hypothetical protein